MQEGRYTRYVPSFVPSFVHSFVCSLGLRSSATRALPTRGKVVVVVRWALRKPKRRLLAMLAGWLWMMRFFCDRRRRRRRRLRNAASDAGPFFFGSVHYPSVRSKSKERTSLSVVSLLLLLPVKFVLELLVYLVFFFSSIYLWFRSKSSLLTSSFRDFPRQRRRA